MKKLKTKDKDFSVMEYSNPDGYYIYITFCGYDFASGITREEYRRIKREWRKYL